MTPQEVNVAMRTFLGGDEDAGYDPLGGEDRLKVKYGERWEEMRALLGEYLKTVAEIPVDWEKENLSAATARAVGMIQNQYPWFDDRVRQKMANYFAYQWR